MNGTIIYRKLLENVIEFKKEDCFPVTIKFDIKIARVVNKCKVASILPPYLFVPVVAVVAVVTVFPVLNMVPVVTVLPEVIVINVVTHVSCCLCCPGFHFVIVATVVIVVPVDPVLSVVTVVPIVPSSETQGQSVGSGENARRKFSSKGGRAPGYRLSPDHFQKFKRMPAPDWAQKMLCIIVPNGRTVSPEFFS